MYLVKWAPGNVPWEFTLASFQQPKQDLHSLAQNLGVVAHRVTDLPYPIVLGTGQFEKAIILLLFSKGIK
jgi:hypothetical protein